MARVLPGVVRSASALTDNAMSTTLHIIWSRQVRRGERGLPNRDLEARVHALLRLGLCGPIEIGMALEASGLLEEPKELPVPAHAAELGP